MQLMLLLPPLGGERAARCTAANDATHQSPGLPHCNARAGQFTFQHNMGFSSVRCLHSASGQSSACRRLRRRANERRLSHHALLAGCSSLLRNSRLANSLRCTRDA